MTDLAKKHLKALKTLNFNEWTASFWLIKRKTFQRKANYSVFQVDIDKKLQKRFKNYLNKQLQSKDYHVAEYDFNNADGDDTLFTLAADATDFPKVESIIEESFENPHIKNYQELLNSWAYIVLFEHENERLYAWRKISSMTQPKRAITRKAIFFQKQKLMDVDDREIFIIDSHFDFFVYEAQIMIANKRTFETSMNFRQGMKDNAEEVLTEFSNLNIVNSVDLIRQFVGDNLHHLRKLSSIRKAGYYKQANYLKKMREVSANEGWNLKIVDEEIVVEEETVELLLKLLNNDRLRSPINNELFDSAAKALVSGRVARA